jgi:hypothetical protein
MSSVELDPLAVQDLTRLRFRFDPTAEEAIGGTAMNWIGRTAVSLMVTGDFNPDTIKGDLGDLMQQHVDKLAKAALDAERHRIPEDQVVHHAFGLKPNREYFYDRESDSEEEATQPVGPIKLPEEFASAIVEATGELDVDFKAVNKIYRGFESTKIMGLVRDIHTFITDPDQANPHLSPDEIFQKVRDSIFDDEYTVEDHEDLYMLCLIPPRCRQLLKHAVISTHVAQHMEKALGEELDDNERLMLDSLLGIFKAEALTGQYWNEFAEEFGISEDTTMEMMALKAESFDHLANINALLDSGKGERVMAAYQDAKKEFSGSVAVASKIKNISAISSEDTGHTFEGFDSWTISCVLRDRARELADGKEPTEPTKSVQHAVIFEDDPRQVDLWAGVINEHFHHTVSNEDVHELPEAVVERAEDPSASLFLLDVQVNNNQTAGIELAQRVVKIRMNMLERADDPDDIPETKIIVWSSSTESLSLARERLKNQLANARVRVSKKGIDSSDSSTIIGGARITVEVRPKQQGLTRYDL